MERAIAVMTDLKDVSEWLTGAFIEQARIVPSGGCLRLELELTRPCPEWPSMGRQGRRRVPHVKSRLSLGQITDMTVQRVTDAQGPMLSCDAIPGGYAMTITGPDGTRWSLVLEQLNGQFADYGQPRTL